MSPYLLLWWKNPSGGRKSCNQGSPVTSSAFPVIVECHHIIVFLVFLTGKWSKLFPGENFKVHLATWPGCLYGLLYVYGWVKRICMLINNASKKTRKLRYHCTSHLRNHIDIFSLMILGDSAFWAKNAPHMAPCHDIWDLGFFWNFRIFFFWFSTAA